MQTARLAFASGPVISSASRKWIVRAIAARCPGSVSVRPNRVTPTVTKRINTHDSDASHRRRRAGRRAWSNTAHRLFVSSERRRWNHQDGELAAGQHDHLSGAGEVEGSTVAHYRHDALQQSDQRRSRYHRPDG